MMTARPGGQARGRYRARTWLRKHLPQVLADRIGKGRQDCGKHEWYNQDGRVDSCYHCQPGRRPHRKIEFELGEEVNPKDARLSLPEAYLAMYYFVEAYWERGGRADGILTMLVHDLGPLADPTSPDTLETTDPAFWSDWVAAVKRALAEGFPDLGGFYDPSKGPKG
jgi:hypothetical protein